MGRLGLLEEELTNSIIAAFYEVYNTLGHGFLEKVYVNALVHELRLRGHNVKRHVRVRVMYKGICVGEGVLDLLVDDKVVLETKSGQDLHPSTVRQLRNYLRATWLEIGLVLHFGPKPKVQRVEFPKSFKRNDPDYPVHPSKMRRSRTRKEADDRNSKPGTDDARQGRSERESASSGNIPPTESR